MIIYYVVGVFKTIILPSGEEDSIFGGEGVPGDLLNIRFNHVQDVVKGTLLTEGEMTYRVSELVETDLLGLGGKINVGDNCVAGTIEIRPVLNIENDVEDQMLMDQIKKVAGS